MCSQSRALVVLVSRLSIFLAAVLALSSALHLWSYFFTRKLFERYQETLLDPAGLAEFPNVPPPPTEQRLRVVFFGDSRAAMWPAPSLPPGATYDFVNRGIGSQTTAQMLLRFDAQVAPLHPDVVVLQAGMNDLRTVGVLPARRQAIITDCRDHLHELIAHANHAGAKVIVTTIFGVNDVPLTWLPFWSVEVPRAIEQVNRDLRELKGPDVAVLDAAKLLADPQDSGKVAPPYRLGMDHLNAAGYAKLNQALEKMLIH